MDTIQCAICGDAIHAVQVHLAKDHPDVTLADYQARFPQAPLFSPAAEARAKEKGVTLITPVTPVVQQPLTMHHAAPAVVQQLKPKANNVVKIDKKPFHEVFGLGKDPRARNGRGEPIPVTVLDVPEEFKQYIPDIDEGHVWNIDDLKNQMMAIEMDIPLYSWGHKGCGKTTDLEQICARTGRPLMRVQHTINTEESHILGQWTIQNGQTVFELGPLPIAMKHGFCYLADEYDFALASVLAVYQPVLEGKSLVIKEADAANRIIKPNKTNFRFFATGNTNGSGDDTGLYQGTSVQNAANYDRFGLVIEKRYMDEATESVVVRNRTGLTEKEATKLVRFANDIREQFGQRKISDTISTRALVYIGRVGLRKGDMKSGIKLCYSNKLNAVDRAVVDGVAQRLYA
jgi:cobaltochelatase CobS